MAMGDRAGPDPDAPLCRPAGPSIGWGKSADFSLSHGAVQLAAEQTLVDIGTFEAERGAKR